ncbi:BTB/POZ domain-containing protein At4g08455-like [Leguminivora glycinivorella]|uniref:BTB/POZ domain-containing protein At4g08455-like n=1 Tax=Leguminivora glycinivorella TaxID=1035111 RepID=UPI00200E369C|nr:BTB/POZ domain-containing protein At4g08455-like [Leguminivora glycinivorella]
MSITVRDRRRYEGDGLQISFYVLCFGMDNQTQTDYSGITVNNLAKVWFRFIQNRAHNGDSIDILYSAAKIPEDCNVKIKVHNSEKQIYSNKSNWEIIDYQWSIICSTGNVFHIDVTINAFKCEPTIYKKLCEDTDFTDFRLTTSDGSVPVHKAYLAALSDVFKAMLCREWKETDEGCIKLPGVSLQTLQHLKDYMYMGTLPTEDLLPLLSIASCYMIEDLKNECMKKLTQTIKPENIYEFLKYSIENDIPELTFAIMKATPDSVLDNAEKKILEERSKEIKEE